IDCETSEPHPMRGHIVGIAVAFEPMEAFYLPFGHYEPGMLALDGPAGSNLPPLTSPALKSFVEVLQDAQIRKLGHNLKHDYLALRRAGINLAGIDFDTMVASYVLDPGRRDHSL